ncbi:zincin-like metallopeptidase domain-containing protein [Variovorax sp. W2I14]|uniref:zincin-like metallopeptidase domain-containing protein n=1 Tax=Variovorax sp. W2I14 TaxID=3042290 RepID=UPI003D1B0AA9
MEKEEISKIHEEVGTKFLELVDKAIAGEWERPWLPLKGGLPRNGHTNENYQGENTAVLIAAGYSDSRFYTHRQLKKIVEETGLTLDWRGQTGYPAFKVLKVGARNKQTGEQLMNDDGTPKMFMVRKYFTVFNAEQVKGLPPEEERVFKHEPIFAVEQMRKAVEARMGIKFIDGGDMACFIPSKNEIRLPHVEQFKSAMGHALTTLHEIAHATGPVLERPMDGKFGTETYAKEEFVAETSTVLAARELGMPTDDYQHDMHISYLQSWKKAIVNDKSYVVKTIAEASRAINYAMEHLREFLYGLNEQHIATPEQNDLLESIGIPKRIQKQIQAQTVDPEQQAAPSKKQKVELTALSKKSRTSKQEKQPVMSM